ncbi:Ribonucleoprotein LSM domain eukaryotic/archaea-type [Penicillium alfredii]|uniref:Ribonucleoprotein LSM domain eukaryotic/archaea-type n=1 Tax=Penicillium alfredii TaxID=1506179 RepID=A0A9W9F8Z1_9EURO|nr:Ribonucleoprotein LSM domain eukaryotic/archaea-type [Penicillium alfredii]KAJ5095811.1 Ribonucleoprotein LSM domain eukaryotic/archaea-type [Penicillium alfredii]
MGDGQSNQFLEGILGRSLRVHTTDSRMFIGIFKCTDAERNIILANSFEYRFPTPSAVEAAAEKQQAQETEAEAEAKSATVKVNMTSRLIGLIVIPGRHITKIELE